MIMKNGREMLVVGGFFGVLIGGLFFAFGGKNNFLYEMLFWSFVGYVGVVYFEIVPNFAKELIKKYSNVSYYLCYLAWLPLIVGCAMVVFLGSLLFVEYDINELNCLLYTSKVVLGIMIMGSLLVAEIRRTDKIKLIYGF